MAARFEVAYSSVSDAVAWGNNAATRPVSLTEHDSVLLTLLGLRDVFARPEVTGALSWRTANNPPPYLSVPWFNPKTGLWQTIPVAGAYSRPDDPERAKWWDAITAMIWRIADLTQAEPAASPSALPDDAKPVAVFGEAREAIITTPGLQFREDPATVRLMGPFVAGAFAAAELAGRVAQRNTTALDAQQLAQVETARVARDALAAELEQLTARGNYRAWVSAAVVVAGAFGYSRM